MDQLPSLEVGQLQAMHFDSEKLDGVDPISRGRHERFVIYRQNFDERLKSKTL